MKFLFLLACLTAGSLSACGEDACVARAVSPDGRNVIELTANPLAYRVLRDGVELSGPALIALTVGGRELSSVPTTVKVSSRVVSGSLPTPFYKKAHIDLGGCEAFVDCGDWGVRLAARNDGVAYRFETKMSGEVRIDGEAATVRVPSAAADCWVHRTNGYGEEETVPEAMKAKDVVTDGNSRRLIYLPLVYSVGGKTVAVTESDVRDYPVWNLTRRIPGEDVTLCSDFAGWPSATRHQREGNEQNGWKCIDIPSGGRWVRAVGHEPYLVKTSGARTFPWRTFVLVDEPVKLCEADIVYALASPQVGDDFSWVKPGKVAWDWWNAWDNQGVEKGCTTSTYKRFIDFAARNGVEYVILDEGWSERLDIWKFHPNVDVPELIRYGDEKGVGIILWMAWAQIVGEEERVARHFAALGAKGFKVDFIDRGDAGAQRFVWDFAAACARHRMLVDYHGMTRPTGMSRAFPNIVNYEGVHGLESMKFYGGEDMMANDVAAFFLRMTAGPLDYTPGAMDNYALGAYPPINQDKERRFNIHPGSLGTRCHQMAMTVAYEAPLQMLADAPTKYEKNAECFAFMSQVPVVWDETRGLAGAPDSFAAVARRKGNVWYSAVLGNSRRHALELDTSFLDDGEWRAELFSDAEDGDAVPMRYCREVRIVKPGERLSVKLASGGGFAARFSPVRRSAVRSGFGENATARFQREIDELAAKGGGTLVVPAGEYVIASLRLTSNVTLHLERNAFLYGSTNLADYVRYENKGDSAYSVVQAEGADNVAIEGEGVIDGRGRYQVRLADGKLSPGWDVLYFQGCRNVRVENVSLRCGSAWTCFLRHCDGVAVRGIKLWSHHNHNNDGIDIESRNVLVENCDIDCEDDAVVLKAREPDCVVEHVRVRNCRLSCNAEHIKVGTETLGSLRDILVEDCEVSVKTPVTVIDPWLGIPGVTSLQTALSAISLFIVDGGSLENVTVRNISVGAGIITPICIRHASRKPRKLPGKGFLRNVLIENVKMTAPSASSVACSITGLPDFRPQDIVLRDLDLVFKGGGRAKDAAIRITEERPDSYPAPYLVFGSVFPAYGFYVRHADGVRFERVRLTAADPDEARPPFATDDAAIKIID